MNRIARKSGLAALALTMSLGMAACGGSDEADSASDETTSTASETTSEGHVGVPDGGGVRRRHGRR